MGLLKSKHFETGTKPRVTLVSYLNGAEEVVIRSKWLYDSCLSMNLISSSIWELWELKKPPFSLIKITLTRSVRCDPNVAASQMTSKQEVYCDVANSGPRFLLRYFVKEREGKHTHLLS